MGKWQKKESLSFLFVVILLPFLNFILPDIPPDDPRWVLWCLYLLGGFLVLVFILIIGAKYGETKGH